MANSRKLPNTEQRIREVSLALAACLQNLQGKDLRLVVGFSGGMDSVVLLHALTMLERQAPVPFSVAAVHVHHGLSSHADAWAEFCQEQARLLSVPFQCVKVSVERGSADGLEAAARRARHRIFASTEADYVVLGHHADDQAETLLFNLLRGTGLAGAAAMRARNERLLRPLLSIQRDAIAAYAHAYQLRWIEDESNADIRFSRNYLRHRLMTPLRQRFPAAVKNMGAAARRFAEAEELLNDLARIDLAARESFPLPLARLQELPEPRARNVLRYLLAQHGVAIPSEARLREALRQMLTAGQDRHPAIVLGSHRLTRRRTYIDLELNKESR